MSSADENDRKIIINIIPLIPRIKQVKFGEKLLYKLSKYHQSLINNVDMNFKNNNNSDKNIPRKRTEDVLSNRLSKYNNKFNENNINNIYENMYIGINKNIIDQQKINNKNNLDEIN